MSANGVDVVLPALAIKRCDRKFFPGVLSEGLDVDVDVIGVRARRIEGVNPAVATKGVLGDVRMKGVGREGLLA